MRGRSRFAIDKLVEALGVDESAGKERPASSGEAACGRPGAGGRAERWGESQEQSESLKPWSILTGEVVVPGG